MLTDLVSSTLLEWINSFSLGTTIRSIDQLNDGSIIWETLQDIDPQYFFGDLPERSPSDHWVPRWQNLKHIHKLLISYIRNQNDGNTHPGLKINPDLKAIAEASSTKETNELLKVLLLAAISSPNAEAYITTMQELSTSTQEGLKDIIQEAHNPSNERLEELSYERDDYKPRRDLPMDPELRFEERVGKVLAENEKLSNEKQELMKTVEDMHNRLARLQENHDTVLDRLTSTEDRLTTLKSGKGDLIPNAKTLESRTRQQEDLIASQEAKIQAFQDEIDSLRMNVESLRVKNQRFQKLQDDYDEVKNERDQLSRRANAAEKYRQKLQASHDFEKENLALKNQVKDLQQQLMESDSNQKSSSERDVELEEYRRVLPRIEQDRHEIQNVKKQLEFNNHALTERLESAEDQLARDEATISELRDRIRELEGLESPTTPGSTTPKAHGTFQRDLDEVGRREAQLKIENEELKREIGKSNADASPTDASKGDTGAELSATKFTENEAYRKLQDDYAAVRKKLSDAESEVQTIEQQLSEAKADLGMIGKEKLDAINAANDSSPPEVLKMRESLQSLRSKIQDLETKLAASQSFVKEVSTERDTLRDEISKKEQQMQGEDQARLSEMKKLLEEVTARFNSTSEGPELSGTDLLKQFAATTERSAENLAKRAEHINQQNELIKSLQERIERHEEKDHDANKEAEKNLMQIIQRQAREIALISSAWYDQQSRLQNGNLSMLRYRHPASTSTTGAEVHRSWLAKQRAIVAGGKER